MRLLALAAAGVCGVSALVPLPPVMEADKHDPARGLYRRVCDDTCANAVFSFRNTPDEYRRRAQCSNYMTKTIYVNARM